MAPASARSCTTSRRSASAAASAATASGSTNRTDNLTASIAVTVTQVLPNGNLAIEGKRKVGMNAETQEITLTGVVRPQDIAFDNTIRRRWSPMPRSSTAGAARSATSSMTA